MCIRDRLYVDDKRDLPKGEQFVSKETGSVIETIGDKWTDFMISKYKTNTQPLYCLLYTSPSPRDRTRSRMPSSA